MIRISSLLNLLIYSIALVGYAPLSPNLETFARIVFPTALAGGILADRKGIWIKGHLPTVISILFFVYYAIQINMSNLVAPAANLLALLLSVRMVCEKNGRNYLQICALSLFSLAGSTLFSLDSLFLLYLILLLFLMAVTLVIITFHSTDAAMVLSRKSLKSVLSVTLLMPAGAIPLLCLFFIILPRTQYPLWNFLNAAGSKVTGLGEKVQPGSAASVAEIKAPAFRVQCEKLSKEKLYWRGVVLNSLKETSWVKEEPPGMESGQAATGVTVHQTIYVGSGNSGYLFTLNVPVRFTGIRGNLSGDLVLKRRFSSTGRLKYEVDSVPGAFIRTTRGIDRNFYLHIPEPLSPRLAKLAKEIKRDGKTDMDRITLLEKFYLSNGIGYANTGLPVSGDPLDEFLFVKKRGNCEYFAASFALLLRAAAVPSRLVGGYFGGEYNEIGGYYLVTEEMAHVWVEAFITGKGWITIDPSTLSADFQSTVAKRGKGFSFGLAMLLDSFNYYWDQTVISYDLERQFQVANDIRFHLKGLPAAINPGRKIFWLAPILIVAIAIVAFRRSILLSREERILRKLLGILKKKYRLEITPATGLHEIGILSRDPGIKKFVSVYCRAIYSDRKLTKEEHRLLAGILRHM